MTQYGNTNKGVLFINDRKEQETQQQHDLDVVVIDRTGAEMDQRGRCQRSCNHGRERQLLPARAAGHAHGDHPDQHQRRRQHGRRPQHKRGLFGAGCAEQRTEQQDQASDRHVDQARPVH